MRRRVMGLRPNKSLDCDLLEVRRASGCGQATTVGAVEIDAVPLLGTDRTPHVVGSRLCLAMVNTVLWRRGPAPHELLRDFTALTELVTDAGWLTDRADVEARAERQPRAAARAVARGRELREHLLVVFSAVAAGAVPP